MITQKEFKRQLLHITIGLGTILFIYFDLLSPLSLFLMIIIGILASIITKRTRLPFFSFFLDNFEREEQMKKFPGKGMIFFFIGVLLVIKLFDKNIALASIMILTLGDSVSHLFGAQFGKIKNIFTGDKKKLLEGMIAGTVAGTLGAFIFVPITQAFLASFAAMLAEVIKIDLNDKTLDDNLVVPLVAGTTIILLRIYSPL
ncbi:MAG: hypothetical protein CMH61_02325 [Nanoarchaeota archaeon]|nr:hypothetical protein [Nanoarchaeota archaeon]